MASFRFCDHDFSQINFILQLKLVFAQGSGSEINLYLIATKKGDEKTGFPLE